MRSPSGNPFFFSALLRPLVNDFADSGVFIENTYFFLYSFRFIPWETRWCDLSRPHFFSAFETDYFIVLYGVFTRELRCGYFLLRPVE